MKVRAENGFTLAEVLVATFITALVSMMSVNLVSSTLAAHRTIDTRMRDMLDLQAGIALIRADLAQIAPRRQARAANGDMRAVFVGGGVGLGADTPMIGLVRLGRGWPPLEGQVLVSSDLSYVEYVLKDEALIRRSREPVDAANDHGAVERIVFQDVSQVGIKYLNEEGWQQKWDKKSLPMAVDLSFGIPNFPSLRCVFPVGNGAGGGEQEDDA